MVSLADAVGSTVRGFRFDVTIARVFAASGGSPLASAGLAAFLRTLRVLVRWQRFVFGGPLVRDNRHLVAPLQ